MKSASLKLNRKADSALSPVSFIDTGCFSHSFLRNYFIPTATQVKCLKLQLFISFSCFHFPSFGDRKVTV